MTADQSGRVVLTATGFQEDDLRTMCK